MALNDQQAMATITPGAPQAIHDTIAADARELSAKLHAHRTKLFPPKARKHLRRFTSGEVAKLVGVNDGYLRQLSLEGRGPQPDTSPSGRRSYTFDDIQDLRAYLDESGKGARRYRPYRVAGEQLQVIGVVNFKGGSGKTTTAAHLAQHLTLQGYRVLAIDLDPQASLSALHGYQPEFDVEENGTLYGAIRYDDARRELNEIIRQTYFSGLDIVPGNIELMEFEHETPKALAARQSGDPLFFARVAPCPRHGPGPLRYCRDRLSASTRISHAFCALRSNGNSDPCASANARCHVDVPISNHDIRPPCRRGQSRRQHELRLDALSRHAL
ncbi:Mrp family chromosome partitioning ATPase [Bradyrhizobium sp. LM6.11]